MLYLMVILQVLAANNVVVPGWILCIGCWWRFDLSCAS